MVAGGSRGGGGGRRGRKAKASKQTVQPRATVKKGDGFPTINVFDALDSVASDFGKGANYVLANPRDAVTPQGVLKELFDKNGKEHHLDTMPDDPLTYITRNELRKAREKRGF